MNHDHAYRRNVLDGLLLQCQRGQLDSILSDAGSPLAEAIKETLERRIRQLVDDIEGGEG